VKFLLVSFIWNTDIWYRFDENYGLAATQSLKNKDIPEGGAKGTILPSYALIKKFSAFFFLTTSHYRLGVSPRLCFEKYVDVRWKILCLVFRILITCPLRRPSLIS
jgi:hypothetical protein